MPCLTDEWSYLDTIEMLQGVKVDTDVRLSWTANPNVDAYNA